jgi:ABC-type Na+ efflux pump permease subunit
VKSIGKHALVLLCSSLLGATLWLTIWLTIFTAIIVESAHLSKPLDIVPGQLLVFGGGFLLAGTFGIAGAIYVLRRFRPWASST